ncbi:hypothetical protein BOTCAL_0166g00240 [Botryotinia calthae]|uniref:BTB domain-containing protein n=1 Tax=Botryotinia calthae TaxID=38488 RepID=A0A4Y8D1K7_9HELO|nr:hypothetical protein BOTCAL_0166g00240 [Botryotinia calthae]
MEHQEDETTNKVINFASDGDLILVVGPEKKRFRVHSLFLKAASKPFLAMFRPEWQEGQSLLHQNGPEEIELPDDDAAALEIILAMIHHKNDEISENITASRVLEIAILSDKYDFLNAMKLASNTLLQHDTKDESDLMRLVVAAYLFRNARAFKNITKTLVLDYHGPYYDVACDEVETVIGWKVFCLLETQRSIARLRLSDILLTGINDEQAKCYQKCGRTCKYAYAYLQLLEKKRLWPARLLEISISEAIEVAQNMPDPVPEESSGLCSDARNHRSPEYRNDRFGKLEYLYEKIGLCLSCVRGSVFTAAKCNHNNV